MPMPHVPRTGRAAAQLVPLPPLMGFGGDDDGRGGGGGGSRRLSTTPTSAGRRGDGDEAGQAGGGGGGGGGRELFLSERPRSGCSVRGGGGGSPCFFATPESSARNADTDKDKENRGEAQQRRAPAWEGIDCSGGGCGLPDESAPGGGREGGGGGRAGTGDRLANSSGSAVRRASSSSKTNVGRATVASAAAQQQPLESSKIRRVARSPATRSAHESGGRNTVTSRAASRGRYVGRRVGWRGRFEKIVCTLLVVACNSCVPPCLFLWRLLRRRYSGPVVTRLLIRAKEISHAQNSIPSRAYPFAATQRICIPYFLMLNPVLATTHAATRES